MIDLQSHFPLPRTRAEKEAWCFTSPRAFHGAPVTQHVSLPPLQGWGREIALAPATLTTGASTLSIPGHTEHTLIELIQETNIEANTKDNTEANTGSILADDLSLHLAEGATLHHLRLHVGNPQNMAKRTLTVTQAAHSTYAQFTLNTGLKNSRCETVVALNGPFAHTDVTSLSIPIRTPGVASGTLPLPNAGAAIPIVCGQNALISFHAPDCTAHVRARYVLPAATHGVFQGKFFVAENAMKTDAYMLCEALLLEDSAQTSHKPELEIYADDVKCSHGATIGSLDPQQLFYLQARGIQKNKAKQILIASFAQEIVALLPDALHMRVHPHVQAALGALNV